MGQDTHVVSVEILGLRYPIRSTLDAGYVTELAAYVDAKMHAAAEDTEAADSVKIAVVAALNIADELFRARDGEPLPGLRAVDPVRERLGALEDLLDRALGDGRCADPLRPNNATASSVSPSASARWSATPPSSCALVAVARREGCGLDWAWLNVPCVARDVLEARLEPTLHHK